MNGDHSSLIYLSICPSSTFLTLICYRLGASKPHPVGFPARHLHTPIPDIKNYRDINLLILQCRMPSMPSTINMAPIYVWWKSSHNPPVLTQRRCLGQPLSISVNARGQSQTRSFFGRCLCRRCRWFLLTWFPNRKADIPAAYTQYNEADQNDNQGCHDFWLCPDNLLSAWRQRWEKEFVGHGLDWQPQRIVFARALSNWVVLGHAQLPLGFSERKKKKKKFREEEKSGAGVVKKILMYSRNIKWTILLVLDVAGSMW